MSIERDPNSLVIEDADSPPGKAAAPARKSKPKRAPRAKKAQHEPLQIPSWLLLLVGTLGVLALVALAVLVAGSPVETIDDPADPTRLIAYALLILGPLALHWSLARGLRMGLFWIFATAAWAGFGYLLIFVPAPVPSEAAAVHYIAFLVLMALSLVALLTPPLYMLGWLIFSQRQRRYDFGRAARQAALIASYLVLLIGMNLVGVFNWLNALLLFVVFALAEFFSLARA